MVRITYLVAYAEKKSSWTPFQNCMAHHLRYSGVTKTFLNTSGRLDSRCCILFRKQKQLIFASTFLTKTKPLSVKHADSPTPLQGVLKD